MRVISGAGPINVRNRRCPAKHCVLDELAPSIRLTNAGTAIQVAVALALALVLAPAVRTVTAELNDHLGRVWPFSMTRCHTPLSPGCDGRLLTSAHVGTARR